MLKKHLLQTIIYRFVKLRIYISSKQNNAEKQLISIVCPQFKQYSRFYSEKLNHLNNAKTAIRNFTNPCILLITLPRNQISP